MRPFVVLVLVLAATVVSANQGDLRRNKRFICLFGLCGKNEKKDIEVDSQVDVKLAADADTKSKAEATVEIGGEKSFYISSETSTTENEEDNAEINLGGGLLGGISAAFGGVVDAAGRLGSSISGGVDAAISGAVDVAGSIGGGISGGVDAAVGGAVDVAGSIGGGISGGVDAAIGGAVDVAGSLGAGISGGVDAAIGGAVDVAGSIGAGISGGVDAAIGGAVDVAGSISTGSSGVVTGAAGLKTSVPGSGRYYLSDINGDVTFERGVGSSFDGSVKVLPFSSVLGVDIGIVSYLNMRRMINMAHKLNYRGISGLLPVKYSMNSYRLRNFKVGSASVGKLSASSFRLSLNDVEFLAKGNFKLGFKTMGVPLDLGGRLLSKVQLRSIKANVKIDSAGKFKLGRCVLRVSKIDSAVINGCDYANPILVYLKKTNLVRKQVVEMGCHLVEDIMPDVLKVVKKQNFLN